MTFKSLTFGQAKARLTKYLDKEGILIHKRYLNGVDNVIARVTGDVESLPLCIQKELTRYHSGTYYRKLDNNLKDHEDKKFKRIVEKYVRLAFPKYYFQKRNNHLWFNNQPEQDQKDFIASKRNEGREEQRIKAAMDE